MAIHNIDVILFQSQRHTNEKDSGGRVTGNEVIDGNIKIISFRVFPGSTALWMTWLCAGRFSESVPTTVIPAWGVF